MSEKPGSKEPINPAYMDWQLSLPNALSLEKDMRGMAPEPSMIVFFILSLQEINEIYGRDMGDVLLREIRDHILSRNVPGGVLYRVSGSKLGLTVEQATPGALNEIAENLAARFDAPWRLKCRGDEISLLCEFSLCVIHSDFLHEVKDLINMIERASNTAGSGKIRRMVYDEKLDAEFKKRQRFEVSLKRCVANGMEGFDVYYQPIADPVTGIWCGLEALCRWNSPELGFVPPGVFIPETERLNLMEAIGLWVLETAIRKCKEWGLDKLRKFILDVNVSAVQFADIMLADKIISVLKKYDYPGEKLCLELTESTQFTFNGLSLGTIQRVKEEKVWVALDDFGTGYSAFNKLQEMPVDIVKIERAFVDGIENDSYLRYLFRAIAELAHTAGMKLIAEGVETIEQMSILLKNGADYLQGYLFSKPIPPGDLEGMLGRFREIDKSFNVIRKQKIDLYSLLQTQNDYVFVPTLHKLMNRCIHALLYYKDINEAIQNVLRDVGLHMEVSRTYVFRQDEGNFYSNTHEWCAEGIAPEKESLTRVPVPESWLAALSNDGIMISQDIADLPDEISADLTRQGIKSIAVVPLWDEDELSGFVGFDDCVNYRDWRPEEILMLYNLCVIIANAMNKSRMQDEIKQRGDILYDALNHVKMGICVSDRETGKILFANEHIKKELGNEFDSAALSSAYRVYESLIPWLDGKKAHLACLMGMKEGEGPPDQPNRPVI